MAKPKKEKKPRPDKYAEKLAINATFEEAIQVLADHANKVVTDSLHEPTVEEPPVE